MITSLSERLPTRRFYLWRLAYGCLLLVLGLPCVLWPSMDVGSEPGWWLLFLGVLPSLAVVLLYRYRPVLVYPLALAHDAFLLAAFLVLLAIVPNYMFLVAMPPFWFFMIEGIVLTVGLIRARNQSSVKLNDL